MVNYKVLCIRQPWASMILKKEKTIELRSWYTDYRGPLLIAASANPKIEGLPCGQLIALANLVECRKSKRDDQWAARSELTWGRDTFSWILKRVKPIKPIPIKGKLGLFEIKANVKFL